MKPKTNVCVHCLEVTNNMTWDHIFPNSWYPQDKEITNKWKVPCCNRCNNRLSKIEKNLLKSFVASIGKENEEMSGIYENVLRSMDPSKAKKMKDINARSAERSKFLSELTIVDRKNEAIFSNLDNNHIYHQDSNRLAINISEDEIVEFGKKIVKGIIYIKNNRYIDSNYLIEILVLELDAYNEFDKDIFRNNCETFEKPGIKINLYQVENDISSVMKICIWKKIFLVGVVLPHI